MPDSRSIIFPAGRFSFRIAWLAFAIVCFQSTFLEPSMVLIPGQRANVFAGVFCGLALLVALFALKDRQVATVHTDETTSGNHERGRLRRIPWRWSEIAVCLILGGLALASTLYSVDRVSSGLRVFVLLTSGLGGFWCARILLCDSSGQERFQWLCLMLLAGAVVWGLVGYFTLGRPSYIFRAHEHPVNTVFLLSVGCAPGVDCPRRATRAWVGIVRARYQFCGHMPER